MKEVKDIVSMNALDLLRTLGIVKERTQHTCLIQ